MAKLEDYLFPEILEKMRSSASSSEQSGISKSDIDELEKLKVQKKSTSPIKEKIKAFNEDFIKKFGEAQPAETVSTSVPKEEQLDFLDELKKNTFEAEQSKPTASAFSKESKIAEEIGQMSKLDKTMEKLSGLSDEALAKLGPVGQKILSSKLVSKGLPALAAYQEARQIPQDLKKDEYLNALGSGLGAASGIAALSSKINPYVAGGLAAAGLGVKGGVSLGKEEAEFGVGEGGMLAPTKDELKYYGVSGVGPFKDADKYAKYPSTGTGPFSDVERYKREMNMSGVGPVVNADDYKREMTSGAGPFKDSDRYKDYVPQPEIEIYADEGEALSEQPQDTSQPPSIDSFREKMDLDREISESTVDALRKAQEEDKQKRAMAMLAMGASDMLRGGLGLSYKVKMPDAQNKFWEEQLKSDQAVQDLAQRQQMEREDPNSPISKRMREIMGPLFQNLGMGEVPGNMTYSEGQKYFPQFMGTLEKQKAFEQTEEYRKELKQEREDVRAEKKQEKLNKRLTDLNKHLTEETASSRTTVFGRAANIKRSAEALETLVSRIKDKNNLDNRQIKEIAAGLDAMLTQGAPTVSGRAGLVPSSFSGDLSAIAEYITNIPKGAQQGAFVKRLMETVKSEKELAIGQIKATKGKILAGYSDLEKEAPDQYKQILRKQGIVEDYPKTLKNIKTGQEADVSNEEEEAEARKDGYQ